MKTVGMRISGWFCLLIAWGGMVTASAGGSMPAVLSLDKPQSYVAQLNADDRESFAGSYPNSNAWDFLSANIPLFECPDRDMELTYYFRWWTFRKHLEHTPDGWVITEFLPPVPWGGKHNTIPCAAGHHIREGRWLADQRYVRDYINWWLRKGGYPRGYSFWIADSVLAWCDATGDLAPAKDWLPELIRNYQAWEREKFDPPMGLFWQNDNADGMEGSISRGGYRPTINSYQYGDALAIARIAASTGKEDLANTYRNKAAAIKVLVQEKLWNADQQFFEVRKAPRALGFFKWRLNDDEALTRSAKATSSAPGPVANLNDGVAPKDSWAWAIPHFKFDSRIGSQEWIQYDLPAVSTVSNMALYPLSGGNFDFPESYKVMCRVAGQWKPASSVSGEVSRLNRWNRIAFDPVRCDGIRLELTMMGSDRAKLESSGARELLGYVPWCFNLPDERYAVAWSHFADTNGFSAPWGLTTAERRHPGFQIRYEGHECLWNGPIWPFATAQTLTALANLLNDYRQDVVSKQEYFAALLTYARSHRLTLPGGKVVPWIDEDQNPFTGDWIARTCILDMQKTRQKTFMKKGGTTDRGKDYNHSTFCDLVINGLIGLRPQPDDTVVVNPLVPEGKWDYFCLDRVPYHGRLLTILWDKSGKRYGKGAGLSVWADGVKIASAETLKRIEVNLQLPPTHISVPYGSDPAQVLDIWLAKSDKPTPIVVYIHGGGWEGGDRGSVRKHGLCAFLDAGISVATIDYRLVTPAIKVGIMPPVRWPLGDAARAVQFIRTKATEWNLDKTRIGLTGGSAGGCSSLWLAMHDDMADPKSADPVARESTRVTCAGVFDAQTTLDPQQLREWFKAPTYGAHAFGFVKEKDGRLVGDMDACLAARGRILPWIKEYSPIEHASADDPPLFLIYGKTPQAAGQPQLDSVHGAAFGVHLKERLDTLGIESHLAYPALPTDAYAPHIQFLIQKLTGKTGDKSAAIKVATPAPLLPVDITKLPKGIKRLDLFLLLGQSNMQGVGKLPAEQTLNPRIVMMHIKNNQWYVAQHPLHVNGDPVTLQGGQDRGVGPGLAFAEALVAREPDVMVGLIPCALGGSTIAMWQKGKGKSLYDLAVQRARLALANCPAGVTRLCGALWLQGESNSTEKGFPNYEESFLKVVDTLRADLDQPELPFIACTIGSFISDRSLMRHITKPEDQWSHWGDINDVFLSLPSKRPFTACVDARDLKDGHIGDYVHYNSEAQAVIGQRFAEKYLQELKVLFQGESPGCPKQQAER